MKQIDPPSGLRRKRMVAAMVLGTALSTLGASPASADTNPDTMRAVSAIDRYCTACWRNAHVDPSFWPDCTQEVFSRLLERVSLDSWERVLKDEAEERREFLRAIDTVKKRSQRSRKFYSGAVDAVADNRDRTERQLAEDRETVRKAAAELLSERQQRVLQLSMQGWSVNEIAGELAVPSERVSDEKYKAISKLRSRLSQI